MVHRQQSLRTADVYDSILLWKQNSLVLFQTKQGFQKRKIPRLPILLHIRVPNNTTHLVGTCSKLYFFLLYVYKYSLWKIHLHEQEIHRERRASWISSSDVVLQNASADFNSNNYSILFFLCRSHSILLPKIGKRK